MAMEAFEVFGTVSLSGASRMMGEMTAISAAANKGLAPAILGIGSAIGVAGLAIAGFAAKSAMDFGKAQRTIMQQTGATGRELQGLKKDFKAVFATAPEDAATTSDVLAQLSTRTGATGARLQGLTRQMLGLGRVTGEQATDLVPLVTRVYGDWSIATKDQAAAADYLYKVNQQTGISVTELSSKVVQFGAPLRALGFDFETSAAMLGKWEKEGVNVGTALAGMRFALKTFGREGIDARTGLQQTIDKIKAAKTDAEATSKAFEVFGVRAGTDLAMAIREGRFDVDSLMRSLETSKTTINGTAWATMTFGEKLAMVGHEAEIALEPLGKTILTLRGPFLAAVKDGVKILGDFGRWFGRLPADVKQNIVRFGGFTLVVMALGPKLVALANGILLFRTQLMAIEWASASGGVAAFAAKASTAMFAVKGLGVASVGMQVGLVGLAGALGLAAGTLMVEYIPGVKTALTDTGKWLGQTRELQGLFAKQSEGIAGNGRLALAYAEAQKTGNWATYDAALAEERAANVRIRASKVTSGYTADVNGLAQAIRNQKAATDAARNAEMGMLSAKLGVKAAQQSYNSAVKQYGKRSDEARLAKLQLRQAEATYREEQKKSKKAQQEATSATRRATQAAREKLVADTAGNSVMNRAAKAEKTLAEAREKQRSATAKVAKMEKQGKKGTEEYREAVEKKKKADENAKTAQNKYRDAMGELRAAMKKANASLGTHMGPIRNVRDAWNEAKRAADEYRAAASQAAATKPGGGGRTPRARGAWTAYSAQDVTIGEGRAPESLIAWDPQYRRENQAEWLKAGRAIGMVGNGAPAAQDIVLQIAIDLGGAVANVTKRLNASDVRSGRYKTRLAVREV